MWSLVIHIKKPWLCTISDSMVIITATVMEIKCPISHKDNDIIDTITNVFN